MNGRDERARTALWVVAVSVALVVGAALGPEVAVAAKQAIVRARQYGNWVVAISGTPNVSVANQPTVGANQSGAWNVSIGNEPSVLSRQTGLWSVAVSNSPTVSIGNEPSVSARQSGTWDFNVVNSPTVKLDSSSSTVTVDSSPERPIYVSGQANPSTSFLKTVILSGATGGPFAQDVVTSTQDWLVIKTATYFAWDGGTAVDRVELRIYSEGSPGAVVGVLPLTTGYSSGAVENVDLRIPPGSRVEVNANLTRGSSKSGQVTISGYTSPNP